MPGPREERYLEEIAGRLRDVLGDRLVGVYVVGSAALGGYVPGRSDLDVLAASAGPVPIALRRAVVERVRHDALPCPARKLELVLYSAEALREPGASIAFELNLNTGAGQDDHVTLHPADEPAHWFLIDVAIARAHARALAGPPAGDLIGRVARRHVLAALGDGIRWFAEHEPGTADAVLNACRAWRFAAEDVWSPKDEAGRWALARGADPAVLLPALEAHAGAVAARPDLRAAAALAERAAAAVAAAA